MADQTQQLLHKDVRNLVKQLSLENSAKGKSDRRQGDAPLSETECAIMWAEALQEVVAVLELQLDDAESGLQQSRLENEILREQRKLSPPPTPGRSNGASSLKSLVDQLQSAQIEEARRHDQERSVQQELVQAKEEATRYRNEVSRLKEEAARLRADLQVEKSHTQQMIAQTSQLQGLWGQYTSSQKLLEEQLQEMTHREAEGRAQVAELQRRLKEAELPQDDEKVQWLEQAVADAQAKAIEERNQAAKLKDENQALHMELKRMQQLLNMNGWNTPAGHEADVFAGYGRHRFDRSGSECSKQLREACGALVELRDQLMKMPDSPTERRTAAAHYGMNSYSRRGWGEMASPQDLMSHSIKAINGCIEQLGSANRGDSGSFRVKHRHSLSGGRLPSRAIETWGN